MAEPWPFGDLRPLGYRTILADPPWAFHNWSARGQAKAPQRHYRCMELDEIIALPVGQLAADQCLLWMWATWPMLPMQLQVLRAWGFRYKTGGAWAKQTRTGRRWAFGTGYVLRSACEPFLIGTIGSPTLRSRSLRNLIEAPTQQHSRKPDEAHEILERLVDGPRCELFARRRRDGWSAWGDEVEP